MARKSRYRTAGGRPPGPDDGAWAGEEPIPPDPRAYDAGEGLAEEIRENKAYPASAQWRREQERLEGRLRDEFLRKGHHPRWRSERFGAVRSPGTGLQAYTQRMIDGLRAHPWRSLGQLVLGAGASAFIAYASQNMLESKRMAPSPPAAAQDIYSGSKTSPAFLYLDSPQPPVVAKSASSGDARDARDVGRFLNEFLAKGLIDPADPKGLSAWLDYIHPAAHMSIPVRMLQDPQAGKAILANRIPPLYLLHDEQARLEWAGDRCRVTIPYAFSPEGREAAGRLYMILTKSPSAFAPRTPGGYQVTELVLDVR